MLNSINQHIKKGSDKVNADEVLKAADLNQDKRINKS
jgi:hypothetical protein